MNTKTIQKDRTYLIRVRDIGDIWAIGSNMEIKEGCMLFLNSFIIRRRYQLYKNKGKIIDVCYGEKVPTQILFPISNLVGLTLLDKNKRPLWMRDLSAAKTLYNRMERKKKNRNRIRKLARLFKEYIWEN